MKTLETSLCTYLYIWYAYISENHMETNCQSKRTREFYCCFRKELENIKETAY